MTLALGIDPGTATTGYGFVRLMPDGELVTVSFGIISTDKDETPSKRLEIIFDELNKLLKKYKPETAAVEKLFFARNVTTGIAVGQARGVVLLALQKAGIETFEYTPLEVKQAVAGYGGADKKQVQEMVRTLLQLDKIPKPDDAADALAIAITHLNTKRY
ncbi:MAG: crossover junction endodeoxyribonuclease RuvC [Chloroflexi bacterium OLB14]|nr:MAG: crossover junction endodeoxyribonuclease RuvC [Chloroflexi bacterium OLB14]